MLKKLYVPGSLRPDGDGFSFKLRNTLATATLVSPPIVRLDGNEVPLSKVTALVGSATLTAADVSVAKPLALTKGAEVTMRVAGTPLSPGAHNVAIRAESKEWETITFDVDDKVS